ncbi:MAG: CDP-alcohol phosphatidyltransferase family protein [Firmicutes bacterium]|nr:CDP-alcohol phosphatidyltransferase family protein [Bacillota bacterium]
MVSVYDLKPKFQQLLAPLLELLIKRKFTPNSITLLALSGSILVGAVIWLTRQQPSWLIIVPVWLFIRMALNAIDGMMARKYDLGTPLGCILNELGDVLSDLALYLPLGFVMMESLGIVVLFCIGAILTEFCGVLGYALGVKRHYEGPMGKSDRAFLVGALTLATVFWNGLKAYWQWIFLIAAIFTVWTCHNRIKAILKDTKEGQRTDATRVQ